VPGHGVYARTMSACQDTRGVRAQRAWAWASGCGLAQGVCVWAPDVCPGTSCARWLSWCVPTYDGCLRTGCVCLGTGWAWARGGCLHSTRCPHLVVCMGPKPNPNPPCFIVHSLTPSRARPQCIHRPFTIHVFAGGRRKWSEHTGVHGLGAMSVLCKQEVGWAGTGGQVTIPDMWSVPRHILFHVQSASLCSGCMHNQSLWRQLWSA
jgi:hypothetical protein